MTPPHPAPTPPDPSGSAGPGPVPVLGLMVVVLMAGSAGAAHANAPAVAAALAFLAGLPYALAALRRHTLRRHAAAWVWGVAVAARLVLLAAPPVLTTDLARYAWDGSLVASGYNPYAHAPADPGLEPLRAALPDPDGITYPTWVTIYPPATELALGLAVAVGGPSPWTLKCLSTLADLALCGALAWMLRRRGHAAAGLLLYAWHPLPILELVGSGHNDALMLAPLVAALVCLEGRPAGKGRWAPPAAGLLLGVAVLAKLFAIVALPFVLRRPGGVRAVALALLVTAAGLGVFAVPWRSPVPAPPAPAPAPLVRWVTTLGHYGREWRWNDGLFSLTEAGVRAAGQATGWLDVERQGPTALALVTKAALAPVVAVVALLLWWRRADPLQAFAALAGCFLLLGPVVHPWYVCWVLPAVVLRPRPAFLWLGWASLLSYLPADPTTGAVPVVVRVLEHGGALMLLVATAILPSPSASPRRPRSP